MSNRPPARASIFIPLDAILTSAPVGRSPANATFLLLPRSLPHLPHRRPASRLPPSPAALIHAKAAFTDGRVIFVIRANLTCNALNFNLELGLVVAADKGLSSWSGMWKSRSLWGCWCGREGEITRIFQYSTATYLL